MAKVFIIYESKYGNTKTVAEKIAEGLKKASLETVLGQTKGMDWAQLAGAQAVLIGSPNHIGNAVRDIRKFIKALGKHGIKGKAAVFDTYMGRDFQKATGKMETLIKEKAPSLEIIVPGLSILVKGTKGPFAEGELDKCQAFGQRIAEKLKG